MIHKFQTSLAMAEAQLDAPWWEQVYRQAFPDFAGMYAVRQDGWAQRAGIDRLVILRSGRTVAIEEKIRTETWPDILLERWSDEQRRLPGWTQRDLACDYLAYALVPAQVCYLLPFQDLRRAWRRHGRAWIKRYREVRAENRGYTTVSVAVPVEQLLQALALGMRVSWACTPEH